jgi:hypothetical protein
VRLHHASFAVFVFHAVILTGLGAQTEATSAVPMAAKQPASSVLPGASKQPVLIFLYSRLDDAVHFEITQERYQREVKMLERFHEKAPQFGATALFQLNGPASETFMAYNRATGLVDDFKKLVQRRVVEVGYDGSSEPTYLTWPRPNLRNAKTARDRWLARGETVGWLLNEARDLVTGDPDPSHSGGLKRTQEVFGPAAMITGLAPWETGSDPETVHQILRLNQQAILEGFLESGTFATRNVHGYSPAVQGVSSEMSPVPNSAPELFWKDNFLRSSSMSSANVHLFKGIDGPEALQKVLDGLDRSKVHVIRIELANNEVYLKPDSEGHVLDPVRFFVDRPTKLLPPAVLRPREEVEAAYGREEAMMRWLVDDFFPANQGSRFVSASGLREAATAGADPMISRETLGKAVADLLRLWDEIGNYPPGFASADGKYFSLADLYQLLATALAERHRTHALPAAVRLVPVYGPLEFDQGRGAPVGSVSVGSVEAMCAEIAGGLNDVSWALFPSNFVPSQLTVEGTKLNASQVLRLMAESFTATAPATRLNIKMENMQSTLGLVYPSLRPHSEEGSTWTMKPAPLRLSVISAPAGRLPN